MTSSLTPWRPTGIQGDAQRLPQSLTSHRHRVPSSATLATILPSSLHRMRLMVELRIRDKGIASQCLLFFGDVQG